MPTVSLTDRLDKQIVDLRAEKTRIRDQAITNVQAVDQKIDALLAAKATLSPEVEASYRTLRTLGLIKEL